MKSFELVEIIFIYRSKKRRTNRSYNQLILKEEQCKFLRSNNNSLSSNLAVASWISKEQGNIPNTQVTQDKIINYDKLYFHEECPVAFVFRTHDMKNQLEVIVDHSQSHIDVKFFKWHDKLHMFRRQMTLPNDLDLTNVYGILQSFFIGNGMQYRFLYIPKAVDIKARLKKRK
ncbi:hypothetical protein EJF36_19500 [Bacillus sp. HMF5848]|uniref:hypothetical protein n=1 Tax=Bacillus sp. HMF5848 TaxID=2495421 RepID=UPI000F7B5AD7|nr:hypothetical protein [Bacillus sp. HMF5848]RSK28885.1 hypothetical protein EJF36_19500 [Bacillus sp. HMF5848]